MIQSIRHKGLRRLYEDDDRSKLPADMAARIASFLAVIDAAPDTDALDRPGFRLHPLKGDLRGFWSITVRANWRIIFRFEAGAAFDLDFLDYH